jgi:mannan endo-1,4-beta-mannosidase
MSTKGGCPAVTALLCLGFTAYAAPADPKTTPETVALFESLKNLSDGDSPRILFGHQLSTASGCGWEGEASPGPQSDVKKAAGDFPAVHGWDFGKLGHTQDDTGKLEGGSISFLRKCMVEADARGGVNTVSWHMPNPVNGGSFYATKNQAPKDGKGVPSAWAVSKIAPEGSAFDPAAHETFTHALDRAAEFFHSLKDASGKPIPVIFRPWHEQSGAWFWWGRGQRSRDKSRDVDDYVKLWRFTVSYLRDTKGVHNLLYAFSPSAGSWDKDGIDAWDEYPGDDCIDILGMDIYVSNDEKLKADLARLDGVVARARATGKIPALTEFGMSKGIGQNPAYARGWYGRFLDILLENPVRGRIAYCLTWANRPSGQQRWVPVAEKGDDVADFSRFCSDERILLEKDFAALRRPGALVLPGAF